MSHEKSTPPESPEIARWYAQLDADAQEYYQERAAVREHMGRLTRGQAEVLACSDTCRYLARRNAGKD